ncbi:MAG: hypothetical protein ACM3PP_08520 [Candidatus Saccharibacteria bacterium]
MKRKGHVVCFIIALLTISLLGCEGTPPEGVRDKGGQVIDRPITSIKSGLPYAKKKACQWNKHLFLDGFNVGFEGKESIRTRKGEIGYYFYAQNVKPGFDASAVVHIDMKKNCFSESYIIYGTAKELIGGGPEDKPETWKIDIDQTFDLAYSVLDEEKILSYENPKIVILGGKYWDFAVYASPGSHHREMMVEIDPVTGKVVNVKQ